MFFRLPLITFRVPTRFLDPRDTRVVTPCRGGFGLWHSVLDVFGIRDGGVGVGEVGRGEYEVSVGGRRRQRGGGGARGMGVRWEVGVGG